MNRNHRWTIDRGLHGRTYELESEPNPHWHACVRQSHLGWTAHIFAYDGPQRGREFYIGRKTLVEAKRAAEIKFEAVAW